MNDRELKDKHTHTHTQWIFHDACVTKQNEKNDTGLYFYQLIFLSLYKSSYLSITAITRHVRGGNKAKLNTLLHWRNYIPWAERYDLERWYVVILSISVIIICNGCDFQSLLFVPGVPEITAGSGTKTFSFLLKNEVRELSALLWQGPGSASSHFHQSTEGRETRSVLPFK